MSFLIHLWNGTDTDAKMQNETRKRQSNGVILQVVSDIHAEWFDQASFVKSDDFETATDLVLIAGDTAHYRHAIDTVSTLFPHAGQVCMISGNHEHYDNASDYRLVDGIDFMRQRAREATGSGKALHFLENDAVVLRSGDIPIRVIGATLWTDFMIGGNRERRASPAIKHLVADYGISALSESGTAAAHALSREFIRDTLATPFDGPSVVMTHHLPSARSISPAFAGQASNASFASELDDLIAMGATMWVHGHTHTSMRYRDAGGTLIVCNPMGRPHQHVAGVFKNKEFNPRLTVAIRHESGRWIAE